MLKLVLLLSLTLLATFYTLGGRQDAPPRDGLAGKYPPLAQARAPSAPADPAGPVVARAAPAPALTVTAPTLPVPATRPARSSLVAAFATVAPGDGQDRGATGLTLALPPVAADAQASSAADPALAAQAAVVAAPVEQYVTGSTVNVRAGPSANTESLARLDRGEAVLVLASDTPGWSMIRIEGDGLEGYVATRFLGDAPKDGIFTPVE
jgi:hypothetical protein